MAATVASDKQAVNLHKQLLQEFNKKDPKLDKCKQIMDQLKLMLTKMSFLPTDDTFTKQDLIISRDCLEIGAHISLSSRDIVAFERYMSQLKTYYFDFSEELPESVYKYQLLGLNLLCLLSQNRVAEFHTELELLPAHEIKNNIYIKHPVSLEQWLMEGGYNKVFLSKDNVPAESYAYFVNILLDTVRIEIANCLEKAYDYIHVQEAARLLFLDKESKKLMAFIKNNNRNWTIKDSKVVFETQKDVKPTITKEIPSEQLAYRALEYAKELEMIV
ncbi:regulatory particle non-ATPase 12 [Brevipalpus obovatus]|uniref:regulatory particle non-ATPase 12 n=1 Tax=Brevipalpus obovatus TaxID=246614 RepID=UPI003D9EAD42